MHTLSLEGFKTDSHSRRSLSDLSLAVAKCKKIVVVTGAGISCSSGIPDFRSSDGLYNMVKEQYPDVVLKGRDLFDASLFRDPASTAVFYTFISKLKRSIDSATPTPTHHFIKTLDSKKKLLRSYTQNIDGLEERVGLSGPSSDEETASAKQKGKKPLKQCRNVQLHGDIHRVRCRSCSAEFPCLEEYLVLFEQGQCPDCPECLQRSRSRVARSARAIRVGQLRPAIVLYDEFHPLGDDIGNVQCSDLARKPDMLIIMGTSLKVHGLKKLVKEFAKAVHAHVPSGSANTSRSKSWVGKVIFVNKTAPGSEWSDVIDYHVVGETDMWVDKVIEDWKKTRPADWEVQQTLVTSDATKKKYPHEVENLPPGSPMVISSPDVLKSKRPPASPSKRRQVDNHYDLQSSPSKRRASKEMDGMPEAIRLFNNGKHNQLSLDDGEDSSDLEDLCLDLFMQDVSSPKKTRPVKSAGSLTSKKAGTTKSIPVRS
ncbi:hst3 protein [Moniliophthora roreri MCA 2997]|uniref:Hst3 protein n=1 Tax=Moniliophthora roreri (strain MCA 2997) TaxID=1381753 RepID=V2XFU5_MONRO|nr:hst3 protein [Moniliophthora roreri MCA 2997]